MVQINAERTAARLADRSTDRPTERKFQRPTNRGFTADGGEVDQSRVPQGYVMEWKRHSVLGASDKRNQALVRQYGWIPVPHKLQSHIMGPSCTNEDEPITRGSDGLYMRPAYLNDEAMEESQRDTDDVLRNQLNSLKNESRAKLGRNDAELTHVRKKTVAVPADTN